MIITGINTFFGGLNKVKIPDWVPGVGGKGINIPLIPMLAKGSDSAPDTFIAGEEGPELITNAKGSKVFTAAETFGLFDALKAMLSFGQMPSNDTVAAATGRVGDDITVVQHVDITNTFHGDRAGQKKSTEAMGKAAGDAVGEMARALAYVRG